MENDEIPDAHITASSQLDDNNRAALARLQLKEDGLKQGGWSALYNDFGQWIQVDLGGSTRVTRVATQGKNAGDAWVVKYRLQYSEDLGITFTFVKKSVNSSAKVCLFDYMELFFYLLWNRKKALQARGILRPRVLLGPWKPFLLELGCFLFVRTERLHHYRRHLNFTFNLNYPARSVNSKYSHLSPCGHPA